MFRRNLLDVLDPFPPFPSTPPLTQPSLQTGIGYTCADPRGGPLFGRMAEQSPPHFLGCQQGFLAGTNRVLCAMSLVIAGGTERMRTASEWWL